MPLAGRVGNPKRRVPGSTSRHLTTERFEIYFFLLKSGPGGGGKIQKGDLKELKIISVLFLSTNEKHIEKPSIK